MALTSYIAESTTSPEFLKYAILSATCIKTNMLDSNTNLAMDCAIDAVKGTLKEGNILSCMLTGICIEGLSVLASVTGDNTWRSLSLSMAESAMHLKQWHGPDGVLSVGSDSVSYKNDNLKSHKGEIRGQAMGRDILLKIPFLRAGLLSRGLLVAYQRNPSNKRFRDLVRSYINVQYNALRDLSSCGSFYDVNWAGPRTRPYTHGQLDALDTIIAAIGVNE
ncbi:hypothetical protein FRC03_011623 [Tulasnella sp. 419]|nr:hypothetical protein FRC03_011623 [Tulasnella sp. 419]